MTGKPCYHCDSFRMQSNPDIDMQPAFVQGHAGRLFTLQLLPKDVAPRGGILYLPPYGEEMHKSRRMAANQARRFASEGWEVCQFDLFGCGDSEGDSGDARWELWREDARMMLRRLRESVAGPVILWGLRLGASLAVDLAQSEVGIRAVLLWQPVISGEQFLTQLLRFNLAAQLVRQGGSRETTQTLRQRLAEGETLEIAGHRLCPELAQSMIGFKLADHQPKADILWLELGASGNEAHSPSSARVIEAWRQTGIALQSEVVACPDFWQSQEIVESAALPETSARLVAKVGA